MKQKIILLNVCLMILSSVSVAASATSTLSSSHAAGIDFGHAHTTQTTHAAQTTAPTTVPGFQTAHPGETGYVGGNMQSAAVSQVANNKGAAAVEESERVREKINPPANNDPLITRATNITQQATSITNNASPFCVNGECETHMSIPPANMYGDISRLSGVAAASHDKNGSFVFLGRVDACRKKMVGFSNCCTNAGWGQDLNLTQCDRYEQKLGRDKEAGLCHEVDEFCSDDIFGFCIEHSKSYCCFPSKLARVIQEQGRAQLHKGWGGGDSPDCRGLSIEELQKIDFGRVDFSEVYADIKKKQHLPNENEVQQRTANKVKQTYSPGAK